MAKLLDPDADLDFGKDWSAWLAPGEVIATATCVASTADPADMPTVHSVTHTDTTVTAWVTDAVDRSEITLTFHITTNAGRADDRSMTLRVRQR